MKTTERIIGLLSFILMLTITFSVFPVSAASLNDDYSLPVNSSFVTVIEENNGQITSDGEIVEFEFSGIKRSRNYIGGAIKPEKSGFKITITNVGFDTVDEVIINLKLYDDIRNSSIATYKKTLKNVRPGNTSFTWYKPKSKTVQERIELTGMARDGKDFATLRKAKTVRWNFTEGKYGSIESLGGHRHHMPSNSVSPLSTDRGPVIRMLIADHKKTTSYGNGSTARNFREKEKRQIDAGKFLAAQKLGISNINSLFGSIKYSTAISEMVSYTRSLGYTQ